MFLGEPLLLILAVAVIQHGLRSSESTTGVQFWSHVSAGLVLRLAASVVESTWPALSQEVAGALLVDGLHASSYLALVFATEIRPDLGGEVQPRAREEELHLGSTLSFFLALFVYCAVIPSQRNPEDYLAGRFSLLLYLCLAAFLVVRFAYLASAARPARWRLVYLFLLASNALLALSLVLRFEPRAAASAVEPYSGREWGLPAFLPWVAVAVAARVSRRLSGEADRAAGERDAPRAWEPLALHALTLPLLHLLLDFNQQLTPPSRNVQQGLVIVYFLFFGALALVHGTWREKKRRLAERALSDSERRYRQLIESHPDAILIEQDGALVYANPAATGKLGADLHGEYRSFAALGFPPRGAGAEASAPIPIECRVAGARGEEMDLEVSYFDVSYMGRSARQAIARDVTEVKRQRTESERLARLAALGQFSAAMAHEIRNPLAAIVMHTFFLAERLPQDDENQRSLADVNAAVDRMQKLVAGVQSFVRPSSLQLVQEDLIAVIDSALHELKRQRSLEAVTFVEDHRHHSADVEIDAPQMVTVFTHLFANAVDAMPDGGTLSVRTANPSRESIEVTIEDTGNGITEEDLGRIFEPFFSRRDGGVGLGLALVARILDQHSGRYRVESEPGTGTRFTLELPLVQPLDAPDSHTGVRVERRSDGRERSATQPLPRAAEGRAERV